MQSDSISHNLSYIYIYIVKTFHKISPKWQQTQPHTGKRGGLTEKRCETHDFTPFSLCFYSLSLDLSKKRRDFKCFRGVTEKNRVLRRCFHAIRRRFHRSRPCSPCFISGRENSQKRRDAAFWSDKIPKPSPPLWGIRPHENGKPPPNRLFECALSRKRNR